MVLSKVCSMANGVGLAMENLAWMAARSDLHFWSWSWRKEFVRVEWLGN
jgi:hypothetical protein